MLVRVLCKRCRVKALWTDEPRHFLEAICPAREGECEAELTSSRPRQARSEPSPSCAPQNSSERPHYEPLSALDSSFLFFESPTSPMHIALVMIFDALPLRRRGGGLDVARIRRHFAARLHWIPRYRQRIEVTPFGRQPVWVDDPAFDANAHIHHVKLVSARSDQTLKELVGRILSKPLDRAKPLWEAWIIEGLRGNRFAIVNKVHHCLVDGVAGAGLVAAVLSAEPWEAVAEVPPWTARPLPRPFELARDEIAGRMRTVGRLARTMLSAPFEAVASAASALGTARSLLPALLTALDSGPPTVLNEAPGSERRFEWASFPLEDVREIRARLGGTVNDVVLATVAGAVGRILRDRGDESIPPAIRAAVPVNVRRDSDEGMLGNRVSIWLMSLPVGEADPVRRFALVREATEALKESRQADGLDRLLGLVDSAGAGFMKLGAKLLERFRPYDLLVTNVPGPQVPLYLLGSQLVEAYPEVPLFWNQSLGIALFSYAGRLYWGFNADAKLTVLPQLVQAIGESFAELCAAADVSGRLFTRNSRAARAVPPSRGE